MTRTGVSSLVQRYWQPEPDRRLALRGPGEYDEALRSLLFEATRAYLRSTTRVWSDLSGGLDSSTVTAVAALLTQAGVGSERGLGTFSFVTSETTASNESAFQRQFLAHYPLEHHTVDGDEHLSFERDEPPSCHPSKALLYRAMWGAGADLFKNHGIATHLTGRGGDCLFCGDDFPPVYLAELARGLKWRQWARQMSLWAQNGRRSVRNLLWHCSARRLTDLYAGAGEQTVPLWLAPRLREEVQSLESARWLGGSSLYESPARELQYRSILYISTSPRFIQIADERHPLLYRPIVEFVLALPWEHLLRPDCDRVIQRRALQGILPDGIRQRRSKTSSTPLLLRGFRENWPKVRAFTAGRRLAELDLVDPAAFQEACARLRHGLLAKQYAYLMAALSMEIWLTANEDPPHDETVRAHFHGRDADSNRSLAAMVW